MELEHLRWREVESLVRYSRSSVDKLEAAGAFPARIKLGAGRVVWRRSEILEWIESKREANRP